MGDPARRARARWTRGEDATILRVLSDAGSGDEAVAECVSLLATNGRSTADVRERWASVLKIGLVKGPWTALEDAAVLKAREQGIEKWSEIGSLCGRTGKQCRERFLNHLDPALSREPWTAEEDARLDSLVASLGTRWKEISQSLPGRSENGCKNRFNSQQRKRPVSQSPSGNLLSSSVSSAPAPAAQSSSSSSTSSLSSSHPASSFALATSALPELAPASASATASAPTQGPGPLPSSAASSVALPSSSTSSFFASAALFPGHMTVSAPSPVDSLPSQPSFVARDLASSSAYAASPETIASLAYISAAQAGFAMAAEMAAAAAAGVGAFAHFGPSPFMATEAEFFSASNLGRGAAGLASSLVAVAGETGAIGAGASALISGATAMAGNAPRAPAAVNELEECSGDWEDSAGRFGIADETARPSPKRLRESSPLPPCSTGAFVGSGGIFGGSGDRSGAASELPSAPRVDSADPAPTNRPAGLEPLTISLQRSLQRPRARYGPAPLSPTASPKEAGDFVGAGVLVELHASAAVLSPRADATPEADKAIAAPSAAQAWRTVSSHLSAAALRPTLSGDGTAAPLGSSPNSR